MEERIGGSLPDSVIESISTVRDIVQFEKEKDSAKPPGREDFPELDLRPRWEAKIFRALAKAIYKFYFRFSRDGVENIPKGNVYLIAANHSSHLDTPAIITALGKEAKNLFVAGAMDYFFNASLKSWFFGNFLHVVPIDRRDNSVQGVKISQHVLSSGKSFLIYPEGTRSRDGEIQQFKHGIGLLSYESGVPIIPVCVIGTYQALPVGRNFPRRSTIKVRIGKPIDPSKINLKRGSKYDAYKEIVDRVKNSIEEMKNN